MNDRRNSLTDKVNVTIHSVPKTNTTYAKVKRNTAYIGNILDKVLKTEKNLTRATLLYASEVLRDGVIELLKEGKSVDLFELGTLYIKPASSMETATPNVSDVPSMTAAFAPCDENGSYKEDISDWICVLQNALGMGNTASTLVFNAPSSLVAGTYRLIVRTASASGGRICKTVRQGLFSEIVTVE